MHMHACLHAITHTHTHTHMHAHLHRRIHTAHFHQTFLLVIAVSGCDIAFPSPLPFFGALLLCAMLVLCIVEMCIAIGAHTFTVSCLKDYSLGSSYQEWSKRQAMVYDILPPSTAVIGYVIGHQWCSLSLKETTQIRSGISYNYYCPHGLCHH